MDQTNEYLLSFTTLWNKEIQSFELIKEHGVEINVKNSTKRNEKETSLDVSDMKIIIQKYLDYYQPNSYEIKNPVASANGKKFNCEKITEDEIGCPICSTDNEIKNHNSRNYLFFVCNKKSIAMHCKFKKEIGKVIFKNSIKLKYTKWNSIVENISKDEINQLMKFAGKDFVNLRSNFVIHDFIQKYFTYGNKIELNDLSNPDDKLIEFIKTFIVDFIRVCRLSNGLYYTKT